MPLQGWLPADAAADLATTALYTAALALVLAVLLHPHFRKFTWDVIETILASALLVVLVLVVLGLPFGAAYITFKGAAFILRSLSASFPHIQELSSMLQQCFRR